MKLRVLMDNNTYIDQYYRGEPAASYYVETEGIRLLVDTGYSDAFIKNAVKMNINMERTTHVVLSHGHNDHTGGLLSFAMEYARPDMKLIAHPDCFLKREAEGIDIGTPVTETEIKHFFDIRLTKQPFHLSKDCIFLGEIPVSQQFEQRKEIGKSRRKEGDSWEPDYVMEDSAVAVQTHEGLFIITGCSHSGICNIVEYAKEVCGERRIAGIIGGFHLFETDSRLKQTIQYLQDTAVKVIYPCHCVSFRAKAKMSRSLNVQEVGVGLRIEL